MGEIALKSIPPILFVRDVSASAAFFRDKLGFDIDFLHGEPPFYGSVSRGGACLHLRFVHEPVFKDGIRDKEQLLAAFINVDNVNGLFAEFKLAGVTFVHPLRKEPWGASAFIVSDPDGNWFVSQADGLSRRRVMGSADYPAKSSTASSRTFAPFAQSCQVVSSLGEWLMPPMLGTKIIP